MRLMEGVAEQEGYCSEDLLLRVMGWKGQVTGVTVGWNVKPRPSHKELPFCSGISLQVSRSLSAKSDLGIKICIEGTELPPMYILGQHYRPNLLHCK
jgi:hypothetical protein